MVTLLESPCMLIKIKQFMGDLGFAPGNILCAT